MNPPVRANSFLLIMTGSRQVKSTAVTVRSVDGETTGDGDAVEGGVASGDGVTAACCVGAEQAASASNPSSDAAKRLI
jgi:hypothetical protein